MSFWQGKKVLVTGGTGFIGSHVVEQLVGLGAKVTVPTRDSGNIFFLEPVLDRVSVIPADLFELEDAVWVTKDQEVVLHAAAVVGGMGFNMKHHGLSFRLNTQMANNMLEAARLAEVERFLMVSSACVYPEHCTIPTPEEEGYVGHPDATVFGYGWAKRAAEIAAQAYARQYGMKIGILRPYNGYGPRDNFDPEYSHVIPALIRRAVAGEDPFVIWGDGTPTRAFLYVDDFARGLIEGIEKYPEPDPVNVGTDEETAVKDVASLILELTGRKPRVVFDTSKPNAQPRRNCDTMKMKEKIGFAPRVSLREGLTKTIDWYHQHVASGKS